MGKNTNTISAFCVGTKASEEVGRPLLCLRTAYESFCTLTFPPLCSVTGPCSSITEENQMKRPVKKEQNKGNNPAERLLGESVMGPGSTVTPVVIWILWLWLSFTQRSVKIRVGESAPCCWVKLIFLLGGRLAEAAGSSQSLAALGNEHRVANKSNQWKKKGLGYEISHLWL